MQTDESEASQAHNPLIEPVRELLNAASQPYTEFGLIQALKLRGLVDPGYSRSSLELFRVHFLVFNALYTLQQKLFSEGWHLEISPLALYLRPVTEGKEARVLAQGEDPVLRDFYLDWDQYRAATQESVEELLADFWRKMQSPAYLAPESRREALAQLDLQDPVSPETIKRRYRRLAMRHHPDRGGSEAELQKINAAMAVLDGR